VTLLDFQCTGLTSTLLTDAADRLRELAQICRARTAFLFVPEVLLPSARAAGVDARAIPPEFDDPRELAIAAAGYVAGGMVKLAETVHEKSQIAPFSGAFSFKAGDVGNPLHAARVVAVLLGLGDQRAVRRVA
jgi:hypothetical protein